MWGGSYCKDVNATLTLGTFGLGVRLVCPLELLGALLRPLVLPLGSLGAPLVHPIDHWCTLVTFGASSIPLYIPCAAWYCLAPFPAPLVLLGVLLVLPWCSWYPLVLPASPWSPVLPLPALLVLLSAHWCCLVLLGAA